jgi:hypothetical protein
MHINNEPVEGGAEFTGNFSSLLDRVLASAVVVAHMAHTRRR